MAISLSHISGDPSKRWLAMAEGVSGFLCPSDVFAAENRGKVVFLQENQNAIFLSDAPAAGIGLFQPVSCF
ncbi:hypothetical protein BA81_05209 [Bacillus safensis FO-36b]|nr:hypothetical protein BA81_05209 [Bacillus safensis FO-36b]GLF86330.1 hypothetical protein R51_13750 [Bacillus safensis]